MNKVILSGNLCKDVELRVTQTGTSVASNCIAVRRDFKSPNGEYETDFINLVAWRTQADYLSNYAKKGDRVELVGRWTVRRYQDASGQTKTANEVVVESISIISKPQGSVKEEPTNEPPIDFTDNDLPF